MRHLGSSGQGREGLDRPTTAVDPHRDSADEAGRRVRPPTRRPGCRTRGRRSPRGRGGRRSRSPRLRPPRGAGSTRGEVVAHTRTSPAPNPAWSPGSRTTRTVPVATPGLAGTPVPSSVPDGARGSASGRMPAPSPWRGRAVTGRAWSSHTRSVRHRPLDVLRAAQEPGHRVAQGGRARGPGGASGRGGCGRMPSPGSARGRPSRTSRRVAWSPATTSTRGPRTVRVSTPTPPATTDVTEPARRRDDGLVGPGDRVAGEQHPCAVGRDEGLHEHRDRPRRRADRAGAR